MYREFKRSSATGGVDIAMTSRAKSHRWNFGPKSGDAIFERARAAKALNIAIFVAAVLFFYKFGIGGTKYAASSTHWAGYPVALVLIAGSAGLAFYKSGLRYAELWMPFKILVRAAGAVILAQVTFDALYPSAWPSNILIGTEPSLRVLIGLALVLGIASQFRPAFLLPLGVSYFAFRYHAPLPFQLTRTSLDFQVLADAFTFPAAALIAWKLLEPFAGKLPRFLAVIYSVPDGFLNWQKTVWAICVGTHLGNYFHSALGKMYIGGPEPFFWLWNNPTYNTIALGVSRLNSPLSGYPDLLQTYFDFMVMAAIPLNIFVFLIQFLSPLAVWNRKLLILFTLAFDCMHLGIYMGLGVFFFFWIALNIIILASLARMSDDEFGWWVKAIAMASCLWGYHVFYQAGLGWLDGRKIVRENFYAHTENGESVLVPPATFGLYAYQIAHGDLYIPSGHHLMRSGGNATISDWEDASNCGPILVEKEQAFVPRESIEEFVRAKDAFYREHPWVKDTKIFYWYPHHSPSNPVFFDRYEAMNLSDVTHYSYVVESVCIDLENGRLRDDIRVRSEFDIGL